MKKHLFMFAIFLTCNLFVMSIKFPLIGSKSFMRRRSVVRHKTFDHVASRKRLLRISKKDMPGSASRKQYAREVFGQASRTTDQQMSVQERKTQEPKRSNRILWEDNSDTLVTLEYAVSSAPIDGIEHRPKATVRRKEELNVEINAEEIIKVANNKKSVDVIFGSKRIKRSINQPHKDLPLFLLYIADNEIKKLTLDEDASETTLVSREDLNGSPPLVIDFHYKENRLYWANKNSIHRSFLNDGSGIQTIHRNLPSVKGIAVDWLGNNIYWIDQKNIMVSRTDGRYRKTLVPANVIDSELVLDPEKGYMYWLSPTSLHDDQNSRIMRADMYTGNNEVDEDIRDDVSAHTQFAIDYYSDRKLYWTTENPYLQIKCLKLDSALDKIKDCKSLLIGLSNPTSLSVSKKYIYGFQGDSIQRINKTDGNSLTPIKENINVTQSTSLKVVHWDIQKEFVGYDACSTWRHCSHLCLPDPSFHLFRCACPDNMTTVGQLYWNRTCGCPSGQFVDPNGDCSYLDAPWNVIATPLNNTAIKLTWLPPKVRKSDQMKYYYIFYGVYPNGIRRWPVGRTTITEFVIGRLKSTIRYVFKVSLGVPGRRSSPVDIKPTFGVTPSPTQPQSASSTFTGVTPSSTHPQSASSTFTGVTPSSTHLQSASSTFTGVTPSPTQPQSASSASTLSKDSTATTSTSSTKPTRSSGETSTNPKTSQSKATYTSSTKPPLYSKVIFPTTKRTSGGSSSSMSSSVVTHASPTSSLVTHPSPTNPLPLRKNKSFPYWTIGVAGGVLILVVIAVSLVCRYKRQIQGDITMDTLPLADPVAGVENSEEDDTEDEMLLPQPEA